MTPAILPVFLPAFGCRERCLFCNQRPASGPPPSPETLPGMIEAFLAGLSTSPAARPRQVAFYGGTFTALPEERQTAYLRAVRPFIDAGRVDSIRLSTRPDALGAGELDLLRNHGVRTVEIGAQSMDAEVLRLSRRGHGPEETARAVERLKESGFEVGLHLMIGLPGDDRSRFRRTLERVIDLGPDLLRLHPTLVLKGSDLEDLWRTNRYTPLSLDEAVRWLKEGLLRLERAGIAVGRVGLHPSEDLARDVLAGPCHPALHALVDSEIAFDMASALFENVSPKGGAFLACPPREVSNLRGQKNTNLRRLAERFGPREILVEVRDGLPRGTLVLRSGMEEWTIRRADLYMESNVSVDRVSCP
jgi:histone acetyltransferase (RNA polymerase elongator complex component)